MVTLLESIIILLTISLLGLILGYLFSLITCNKINKSKIIQKGKLCEEREKISKEYLDLLKKESKDIVDTTKQNSTEYIKNDLNSSQYSNSNKIDDLKKIKGIGKVIEKQLNALGIYNFEQIASLKDSEINKIDNSLSFKGRIKREKWVEQAKELISK